MRLEPITDLTQEVPIKFRNPGTLKDILPETQIYWHHTEDLLMQTAQAFGYRRLIAPALESKLLYTQAFGDAYNDKIVTSNLHENDQEFVFTAHPKIGALRSFRENGFSASPPPFHLYHETTTLHKTASGPVQHHYFNFDILGAKDPTTCANQLFMLSRLAKEMHAKECSVIVNSSGCSQCRPAYNELFKQFAAKHKDDLCATCAAALDPVVLHHCAEDARKEWLAEAPILIDHICYECHSQLTEVLELCDQLNIPYDIQLSLFSTHGESERTTFAIRIGDELTPAIMGYYYDTMASKVTDQTLPALGITVDLELLHDALEAQHLSVPETTQTQVFMAQLGAQAKLKCVSLLQQLYGAGYCVATACESGSITQQLQVAERLHARLTLIIGQKEAINGHVILRDMTSGLQDNIYLEDLIPAIKERLALRA